MSVGALHSCSSSTVYMADKAQTFEKGDCSIQVFYSKQAVDDLGPVREVCVVEGSSAASFDHSQDGAIRKNLSALCKCGVDMAYVSSSHRDNDMGFKGISYVTLIGFKLK
jgi:hypothetical protein